MPKIPWNKGKKLSEEHKNKLSLAKFRNPVRYWLGKKLPRHVVELMKSRNLGKVGYWKGKERKTSWMNGNKFFLGHRHSDKTKEIMSKSKSGSNHYRWIYDRNIAKRNIRGDAEYKQWRLKVLKRDNYICFDCGKIKKGETEADHIYSWSKYPKLRYEIENGRTLCKPCHRVKTLSQLRDDGKQIYSY